MIEQWNLEVTAQKGHVYWDLRIQHTTKREAACFNNTPELEKKIIADIAKVVDTIEGNPT